MTAHPLRQVSNFLDNGEGVLNTPTDASRERSPRDLPKASIFVACVPLVWEKTGSENRRREGGGYLITLLQGAILNRTCGTHKNLPWYTFTYFY